MRTASDRKHGDAGTDAIVASFEHKEPIFVFKQLPKISWDLEASRASFGTPSCLLVTSSWVCVGSSLGMLIIFDRLAERALLHVSVSDSAVSAVATYSAAAAATAAGGPTGLSGPLAASSTPPSARSLLSQQTDPIKGIAAVGCSNGLLSVVDLKSGQKVGTTEFSNLPIVRLDYITQNKLLAVDAAGNCGVVVCKKSVFRNQFDLSVQPVSGVVVPGGSWAIFASPDKKFSFGAVAGRTSLHLLLLSPTVLVLDVVGLESDDAADSNTGGIHPDADGETAPSLSVRTSGSEFPLLVLRLGSSIHVFQVNLETADLSADDLDSPTSPRPRISLLPLCISTAPRGSWSAGRVSWISGSYVLLSSQSGAVVHLIEPFTGDLVESFSMEVLSASQMCFSDMALYVLCGYSVFCLEVSGWEERIRLLVAGGMYVDAMHLCYSFFEGSAKAPVGLPTNAALRQQVCSQKMCQIVSEVLLFVQGSLGEQLIPVCVDYCLKCGAEEFLFSVVAERLPPGTSKSAFLVAISKFADRISRLPYRLLTLSLSAVEDAQLTLLVTKAVMSDAEIDEFIRLCAMSGCWSCWVGACVRRSSKSVDFLDDMLVTCKLDPGRCPALFDALEGIQLRQDHATNILLLRYLLVDSRPEVDHLPYPRLHLLSKFDSARVCRLFDQWLFGNADNSPFRPIKKLRFEDDAVAAAYVQEMSNNRPSRKVCVEVLAEVLIDGSAVSAVDVAYATDSASAAPYQLLVKYLRECCMESSGIAAAPSVLVGAERMMASAAAAVSSPTAAGTVGVVAAAGSSAASSSLPNWSDEVLTRLYIFVSHSSSVDSRLKTVYLLKIVDALRSDAGLDQLIDMAMVMKLHRVVVELYMKQRKYMRAFQAVLSSDDEALRSSIFGLILVGIHDRGADAMRPFVQDSVSQLVSISPQASARLIFEHFSADVLAVIRGLDAFPQVQFDFLSSALDVEDTGILELLEKNGGPRAAQDVSDLYFRLMCRFRPSSVYRFLQTHDNYRPDFCLRLCQEYKITNAIAYLMERSGDAQGAVDLMVGVLDDVLRQKVFDKPLLESSLQVTIELCGNSSGTLDELQAQALWFSLLDVLVRFQRDLSHRLSLASLRVLDDQYLGACSEQTQLEDGAQSRWAELESLKRRILVRMSEAGRQQGIPCSDMLRDDVLQRQQVVADAVQLILMAMATKVSLSSVVTKIVCEHGSDSLGLFRSTLMSILENYAFECHVHETVKRLVVADEFRLATGLRSRQRQPVAHAVATDSYSSERDNSLESMVDRRRKTAVAGMSSFDGTRASESVSSALKRWGRVRQQLKGAMPMVSKSTEPEHGGDQEGTDQRSQRETRDTPQKSAANVAIPKRAESPSKTSASPKTLADIFATQREFVPVIACGIDLPELEQAEIMAEESKYAAELEHGDPNHVVIESLSIN